MIPEDGTLKGLIYACTTWVLVCLGHPTGPFYNFYGLEANAWITLQHYPAAVKHSVKCLKIFSLLFCMMLLMHHCLESIQLLLQGNFMYFMHEKLNPTEITCSIQDIIRWTWYYSRIFLGLLQFSWLRSFMQSWAIAIHRWTCHPLQCIYYNRYTWNLLPVSPCSLQQVCYSTLEVVPPLPWSRLLLTWS